MYSPQKVFVWFLVFIYKNYTIRHTYNNLEIFKLIALCYFKSYCANACLKTFATVLRN